MTEVNAEERSMQNWVPVLDSIALVYRARNPYSDWDNDKIWRSFFDFCCENKALSKNEEGKYNLFPITKAEARWWVDYVTRECQLS
jgi:hypothetical protein